MKPKPNYDIGDIVKVKDHYYSKFCHDFDDRKALSPYAVVHSLTWSKVFDRWNVGGVRIHYYPGDEEKYAIIERYPNVPSFLDFDVHDADSFEIVDYFFQSWRKFCKGE
jgi:hypothetical protein